jgi:DNA primase
MAELTKASVRKLGYAVLVEGYFDFAQVFQTQAAPVVASCGTALTPYPGTASSAFLPPKSS